MSAPFSHQQIDKLTACLEEAEGLLRDVQSALHAYQVVGNMKLPILEKVDSYFAALSEGKEKP